MNKIKSLINSEPEVRADKVADLKARIKSGEYKVDSERLAKKCLKMLFRKIFLEIDTMSSNLLVCACQKIVFLNYERVA